MRSLINEFWSTFQKPWKDTSFVLYFLLMVLGFGGCGVYLSIYQYGCTTYQQLSECCDMVKEITKSAIAQNIMTYAIAILIPAALSIFLHIIIPRAKHKISHSIITITILIIMVLLVCFTYTKGNFLVAVVATVFAWLFWIIANSDNDSLKDESYNSMIKKEVNKHGQNWD